jgi:hypothetical protein
MHTLGTLFRRLMMVSTARIVQGDDDEEEEEDVWTVDIVYTKTGQVSCGPDSSQDTVAAAL